jgi:hypothetical protein
MHLVSLFDKPRSNTAFCLSTKDRAGWTRASLPNLIAEGGFDLLWVDGSATPEGRSLPVELAAGIPQLREIHTEVTGGPDVAIIYALCRMKQLGYEYCGLIENDVQLKPGWFSRLQDLFRLGQQDGLRVGAVTARSFRHRVLIARPNYSVLWNCGAGMILLRNEAVSSVLGRYRTTTAQEIRNVFLSVGGADPARAWGSAPSWQNMSADCFFDSSMLLDGYCTLGLTPAMADDLDPVTVERCGGYVSSTDAIPPAEDAVFSRFVETHRSVVASRLRPACAHIAAMMRLENERCWHVFPHQAVSLGVARLEGDWQIQWQQFSGPFALETHSDGARVAMELSGPVKFLFTVGAGNIEVVVNQAGVYHEIPPEARSQILHCAVDDSADPACYSPRRIELIWHKNDNAAAADARWRWLGVWCQEIQPWFCREIPIDFEFLGRYLSPT